jgi:protein-disulfide isomerase
MRAPKIFTARPSILTIDRCAAALLTGVLSEMPYPTHRLRFWTMGLWVSAVLALLPASPVTAAEFSPDQREAIEGIVRDYLAKNPEILVEALQAAESKARGDARDKASAALAARRQEVFNDPDAPVAGNPQGDASLVEFFDYRCPYCKQVEPALEALLAKDKELRFVYKEFPVLGPASVKAARAALASRQQGKYDAFHRAMMATKGEFDEAVVYKVAGSVGLDVERLKHDMAAPEIDRILKANTKLAEALDIRGTPGFVIGDEIVPGAVSLEALKKLIDAARNK